MQTAIVVALMALALILVIWIAYDIRKHGDFSRKDGLAVLAIIVSVIGIVVALPNQPPIQTNEPTPTTQGVVPRPTSTRPSITPTIALPTPTPVPPTRVIPTSTPKPQSLGTVAIPSNSSEGITFVAKQQGQYTFTYAGGAYSPEPAAQPADKQWRTRIQVYKNRQIEWGPRQLNPQDDPNFPYREPVLPDAVFMGNYFVATQAEATGAGKSASPLSFDLHVDDYLIFVAMDDKGFYGNNQGAVTFEVFLVPR